MSAATNPTPSKHVTLNDQAAFVERLVERCRMIDGSLAGTAQLTLTLEEIQDLERIGARLRRIAPVENEIRRMVTGR